MTVAGQGTDGWDDDDGPARPQPRKYWHSDHYTGSGSSLVGPVWDVLADHPEGVTVPQIRDVLLRDRRVRAVQSWLLSFGAEQRHRPGSKWHGRYRRMDPASTGPDAWTWDAEQRFAYALTERVHDRVRIMVTHKEAVTVGTSELSLQESDFLQHVVGGVNPGGRHGKQLPLYTAGAVPLVDAVNPVCECGKVHHKSYKRRWVHHEGLGPDPFAQRLTWREEVEAELAKGKIVRARDLLTRGLELMPE